MTSSNTAAAPLGSLQANSITTGLGLLVLDVLADQWPAPHIHFGDVLLASSML
ncbi:hypothetical protein [Streptomyces sp. NWU339]|uniref:hypothetical protein n=1 Tax=Streptomyces sp. NWU339 TaxID=2185284 RepID=UPI0015E822EB|nr:hypothetical protein [Streptomyces sp. NWU339]